jgi:hypothetical protein
LISHSFSKTPFSFPKLQPLLLQVSVAEGQKLGCWRIRQSVVVSALEEAREEVVKMDARAMEEVLVMKQRNGYPSKEASELVTGDKQA